MKIYTKTGDSGQTSLFGGTRLPKDAARIEAYGNVDELNSALGIARSLTPPPEIDHILSELQSDLFTLGADLATPLGSKAAVRRVSAEDVTRLETRIDALDAKLEPLKKFILPGGSQLGASLHVARSVCRRAERSVVHLSRQEDLGSQPIVYLNRLSDLLFVLARYANHLAGRHEQKWEGKNTP